MVSMTDSFVRAEINRVHASDQRSEFELTVLDDILQFASKNGIEYHLDPKKTIQEFWATKLE